MIAFILTPAERAQLQILSALNAFDDPSAKPANKWNGLNGIRLSGAMFRDGLVGRAIRRAQYGEPQRTVYWITQVGLDALDQPPLGDEIRGRSGTVIAIDELAYDAAADAAEQIP